MHHHQDNARKQAQRQEADREEKLCLDKIVTDDPLLKINESHRCYKEQVDSSINLARGSPTNKELLQRKWLEFLALKIDNFAEYQKPVPIKTVATRSRSLNRKPQRPCHLQRTWTRVQSMDREKMDEDPTFSFLRWPRPGGESVLTKAGSPLAVPQPLEEPWKEASPMKPQKMMNQVKREVLMNLNQNTQA